jgi:hypothetical protein
MFPICFSWKITNSSLGNYLPDFGVGNNHTKLIVGIIIIQGVPSDVCCIRIHYTRNLMCCINVTVVRFPRVLLTCRLGARDNRHVLGWLC